MSNDAMLDAARAQTRRNYGRRLPPRSWEFHERWHKPGNRLLQACILVSKIGQVGCYCRQCDEPSKRGECAKERTVMMGNLAAVILGGRQQDALARSSLTALLLRTTTMVKHAMCGGTRMPTCADVFIELRDGLVDTNSFLRDLFTDYKDVFAPTEIWGVPAGDAHDVPQVVACAGLSCFWFPLMLSQPEGHAVDDPRDLQWLECVKFACDFWTPHSTVRKS